MTESTDTDPKAQANYQSRMRKQWALEAAGKLITTRQWIQAQDACASKTTAIEHIDRAIEHMHAIIRND